MRTYDCPPRAGSLLWSFDTTRALQGDKAIATYQEAEAMLAEDFPVIPLWYGRTIAGHSENIAEVEFTPFESPDLASVRLS